MDTTLASAALEAFSILAFGIFSLLMINVTLKRKYSIERSLALFTILFVVSYILLIPLRLYANQFPADQEIDLFSRQINLTSIVNMLAELSAILIMTVFVYLIALKGYDGKTSAKTFVASFTALIAMIISTFFSDYAMLAYNNLTDDAGVLEQKVIYAVLQTVLLAAIFLVYNFLIKNKVKKLISDTNGEMGRFVVVPILSYIIFITVYCAWYIGDYTIRETMNLQYLITSLTLPILYILMFRVIFTEISAAAESMKTETELNAATLIQTSILPQSQFNGRKGISLSSAMIPAKEVGGDFYDFFELESGKIAVMIADVSGKGIPAALFMMHAHSIIKNNIILTKSPAEALTKSNLQLLENNDSCMFVTVFAAVLDINSGIFTYSNAGHNPPLIVNESLEYLKVKKQPVLGIVPTVYENSELSLSDGAVILLYTDGVTEAMDDSGEEYGTERLLNLVKTSKVMDMKELVNLVNSEVNSFSKQPHDDVTMVALEYTGTSTKISVPAVKESLKPVQDLISSALKTDDAKLKSSVLIAVEEIFVNIVSYAYPDSEGTICVIFDASNGLTIQFEDSGIPFNPLEADDPDPSLSLEERSEGGYGIYLVKKFMDSVSYTNKDGKNILTLKKML